MEFKASFPAHGKALEPVEQGEGLLQHVAELAQALIFGVLLQKITGMILRRRSSWRTALES
ncbi:hypothetical protein [Streptomyces sp900116325]|uniref:hypothetical protein n=1 Tax=Streptomyces sp. 900116325 TaxID=3154295 RepID=UPI0033ECF755